MLLKIETVEDRHVDLMTSASSVFTLEWEYVERKLTKVKGRHSKIQWSNPRVVIEREKLQLFW